MFNLGIGYGKFINSFRALRTFILSDIIQFYICKGVLRLIGGRYASERDDNNIVDVTVYSWCRRNCALFEFILLRTLAQCSCTVRKKIICSLNMCRAKTPLPLPMLLLAPLLRLLLLLPGYEQVIIDVVVVAIVAVVVELIQAKG